MEVSFSTRCTLFLLTVKRYLSCRRQSWGYAIANTLADKLTQLNYCNKTIKLNNVVRSEPCINTCKSDNISNEIKTFSNTKYCNFHSKTINCCNKFNYFSKFNYCTNTNSYAGTKKSFYHTKANPTATTIWEIQFGGEWHILFVSRICCCNYGSL